MPASLPAAKLEVDVDVDVDGEAPAAPALGDAPVAPAAEALGEAPVAPAAEALGEADERLVVEVELSPPAPKVTAPVASWTLSGGGGITPLRTCWATPPEADVPPLALLDVEVLPVAAALLEGEALEALLALLAGEPLLAEVPDVPVPDVPVLAAPAPPLVEALAAQAALLGLLVAVVAPAELAGDGRADVAPAGDAL